MEVDRERRVEFLEALRDNAVAVNEGLRSLGPEYTSLFESQLAGGDSLIDGLNKQIHYEKDKAAQAHAAER